MYKGAINYEKVFSRVINSRTASMLVGCGKKEEKTKTDNSLKDVQSKKRISLGLDSSFPPMGLQIRKIIS